jgi:hypothetical protein
MNRQTKLAIHRKESRIRRLAARQGFHVRKSRSRDIKLNDYGEYMLIDNSTNVPVLGWSYDASLDDIAEHLAAKDPR